MWRKLWAVREYLKQTDLNATTETLHRPSGLPADARAKYRPFGPVSHPQPCAAPLRPELGLARHPGEQASTEQLPVVPPIHTGRFSSHALPHFQSSQTSPPPLLLPLIPDVPVELRRASPPSPTQLPDELCARSRPISAQCRSGVRLQDGGRRLSGRYPLYRDVGRVQRGASDTLESS